MSRILKVLHKVLTFHTTTKNSIFQYNSIQETCHPLWHCFSTLLVLDEVYKRIKMQTVCFNKLSGVGTFAILHKVMTFNVKQNSMFICTDKHEVSPEIVSNISFMSNLS